ncbi:GTPase Era [Fodinicola acaciae]|uniref:GTPase Era n=1 Tax=Fodinicola acaciae TaxID=2681555 RepID=UPI001FEABF59|nr:GTPase Era [Fodinicola acaciae]
MSDYRAGFVCLVGRPNTGKSTLINALVGRKVAITSSKPQTTRHAIRGIVHRPDAQIVLVDTPGLHKPRTLLGQRLNDLVRTTWSEVDAVVLCIPANEPIGPGDRRIAADIAGLKRATKFAVVTKTDTVTPPKLAEQLMAVQRLGETAGVEFADIVPLSAVAGDQVELFADLLVRQLPESPPLYPDGEVTDEPTDAMVAELIREAALEGVRDELPHSLAVTVEEMTPRDDSETSLVDVHATVYVERNSQKAIVLGAGGSRMKEVGSTARAAIEELLGRRVYLDLHVKVAKEWQRDPRQLRRLGF